MPAYHRRWKYDGQKKQTLSRPQGAVVVRGKIDTEKSPSKDKIITEGRVTTEKSMVPQEHIVAIVPSQWMTVVTRWRGGTWGKQKKLSSRGNSLWKVPVAERSMAPLISFLPGHIPNLLTSNYQKMSERKIQHTDWKVAWWKIRIYLPDVFRKMGTTFKQLTRCFLLRRICDRTWVHVSRWETNVEIDRSLSFLMKKCGEM